MEAIKNLNEPTGSHRTTIANYIEVCILLLFLFLSTFSRTYRLIICFMVCLHFHFPLLLNVNIIFLFCLYLVSQSFLCTRYLVNNKFIVFYFDKSV